MDSSNSITSKGQEEPLPIVIAGGGCVGLFLALLLCQSDIPNPIIVIELSAPDANNTRAMAHQPSILPLYAKAGILDTLSEEGMYSTGLCFRTPPTSSRGSRVLAGKQFQPGEPSQLLIPQYKFQQVVLSKLHEYTISNGEGRGRLEVKLGSDPVQSFDPKVDPGSGSRRNCIKAHYLIGADGSHSAVRYHLKTPFDEIGTLLESTLVATDILCPKLTDSELWDANFIVDSEDFGLVGRIDDQGLWRVSYGIDSASIPKDQFGEISEGIIREALPAKLAKLLPENPKEGEYEVRRVASYTAQQRCVRTMWKGRIGVIGDAAHVTNPYAGLGLLSGLYDASSLAAVLGRVLSPSTSSLCEPTTLLESWSQARIEKFKTVVDPVSRAALNRVRTRSEDIEGLSEKDPVIKAMKAGEGLKMPDVETNVSELAGWLRLGNGSEDDVVKKSEGLKKSDDLKQRERSVDKEGFKDNFNEGGRLKRLMSQDREVDEMVRKFSEESEETERRELELLAQNLEKVRIEREEEEGRDIEKIATGFDKMDKQAEQKETPKPPNGKKWNAFLGAWA
ncbi:FAD/NAD(P)-binding domain-containing protein [Delitschia confertaspora ATCC 74209]|uniref:FAD/NAD(P)-binding domain-containing protein n=1 Tax=Delitschia confertaspora ATCC 74209 TaxID=1513339 RepID=A0A9P4JWZ6_9PLEO|nr:FAD/NAD(P)-binding domain-containing protein [Delitschia confertaspora ATCC 74209]